MRIASFLLSILLLMSCGSARHSYNKEKYNSAYKIALRQLKRDKSVAENRRLLAKSLQRIIESDYKEVNKLRKTGQRDDYVDAYEKLQRLQNMIIESESYTNGQFNQRGTAISEQLNLLKVDINQSYFDYGLQLMHQFENTGDKSFARKAYESFEISKKYDTTEPNIDNLLRESLELSQLIYVVAANQRFGFDYNYEIDWKFNDVENQSGQFQKIIYEPYQLNKEADCVIDIVLDFDVNTNEQTQTDYFTKDIISFADTITVSATVYTINTTKTMRCVTNVDVRGNQNCNLRDARFDNSTNDQAQRIEIEGDERAVPPRFKTGVVNQLISDDRMAAELIDEAYRQVTNRLF